MKSNKYIALYRVVKDDTVDCGWILSEDIESECREPYSEEIDKEMFILRVYYEIFEMYGNLLKEIIEVRVLEYV